MTIAINMPSGNSTFSPGQQVTFGGDHGPPTSATITPEGGLPATVPLDGLTGTTNWTLPVTLPTTPGNYVFTVHGTGMKQATYSFSISGP